MSKSATQFAEKLLEGTSGSLEDLCVYQFADDKSAHDDALIERLYVDFATKFERAKNELTRQYGAPSRTGQADEKLIPLNGVFRFAIWNIGKQHLFVAASHEDRGVPILLMLGTI